MEYLQYRYNNFSTFYLSRVLNLVISGIPSILSFSLSILRVFNISFKPCYKWNTFNTLYSSPNVSLNIFKSFKPCYKWNTFNTWFKSMYILLASVSVLNLVISGIPSILVNIDEKEVSLETVLNLVISGIPSIHSWDIYWWNVG